MTFSLDYCELLTENVGRLKKLEYLNLALNNIERVENLEGNFVCQIISVCMPLLTFVSVIQRESKKLSPKAF